MLAIIGGSGAGSMDTIDIKQRRVIRTPYGSPSDPVIYGELSGHSVLFLPRHGISHTIPPHAINYRANLWALRECGAREIIALNAVGSINADFLPTHLVLPDQIIDYTWGRVHTFFDGRTGEVQHVDFTVPYDRSLRSRLDTAARELEIPCHTPCVYAITQGPRLESAAEIDKFERDGADLVGMTGMPEAALARELDLPYASLCIVVNMAAGRGEGEITMEEITRNLVVGIDNAYRVLAAVEKTRQ